MSSDGPSPLHPQNAFPLKRGGKSRPQPVVLITERFQVERKNVLLTLLDNPSGRCLRIVEESRGHYNFVMIPATGLAEFIRCLDALVAAETEWAARHPGGNLTGE
jgi:hypothetical protein